MDAAAPRPRCRTATPAEFGRCGRSGGGRGRRGDADLDASTDLRRARHRRLVPGPRRRAARQARPQRVTGQGAWWPARPARPVVPGRPGGGLDGAPDVSPGRALPDAFRRGLPRPDGDRVPAGLALRDLAQHLRVHPPAPRQVHHGGRYRPVGRGRRGLDERARGSRRRLRGRAAPRRPIGPRPAGRRATPCGDGDGDPDLRPHDPPARVGRAGPGIVGPGHRPDGFPARGRLRRRPTCHARPRQQRRRRRGRRRGARGARVGGPSDQPAPGDRRRLGRRGGVDRPADLRRHGRRQQ